MEEKGVAVVGMACRFPGANDIDEYWKVLVNGECHVKPVTKDRWNIDEIDVHDDDAWKPCARNAGMIDNWDRWDNKFFGISDTEAGWMDPQQCLAIEVTHSALENAGFTKKNMKGTKTGVYIGLMNDDFSSGFTYAKNEFNNFFGTGTSNCITANRISYYYDLRGPSITLDTACSSALVAAHLGCQAIRLGECDMAICGGVNIILNPMLFVALSKAKMISPTGLSHTFSDKADGYVRGEGCGIIILKDLKKARRDGDHIWGILGTGCNQDGQTNVPITAPSSQQQISLLNEVYRQYEIDPRTIQYIEAHGTGTPVGDPIEMKALSAFVGQHLKSGTKVPVGSVKTNIGHLESAAGTAGLIKVLLMMNHGKIVPSLHFKEGSGNPRIDFESIPLAVATSVRDWQPNAENKRVACTNSFGFGGTNSHAVLVQEQKQGIISKHLENDTFIICVTGNSIQAVKKTCQHLKQRLQETRYNIKDLSYTSLIRRDHYNYRMTYIATSIDDVVSGIDSSMEKIDHLEASNRHGQNTIFLFCGVGTVWNGTCKEMYRISSIFRTKLFEVDRELKKMDASISLIQAIKRSNDNLIKDSFVGPLIIFACQVALFHLWTTLGICPDTIIGQSVGEIAAAYAAGCISLQDAVKIIYHRSLLTSQTQKGLMMVIGKCDVKEIEKHCAENESQICIAVYSSREACVVSGSENGIQQLKKMLEKQQPHYLLKVLDVACAYHSSYMDSITNQMMQKIQDIHGEPPKTHLISTVTGQTVTDALMATPGYWCRNLREPVRLMGAVSNSMLTDKKNIILEIGPKPVIRAHLQSITHLSTISIASLNQPNEHKTFVSAIAELFRNGYTIDFKQFFFDGSEIITDIPRYQFNRSEILIKSDAVRNCLKGISETNDGHPFVSRKPSSSDFKIDLFPVKTPFVFEHVVQSRNIAPGALYAEIGLVISQSILNIPVTRIQMSLEFLKPLHVSDQSISLNAHFNENESTISIRKFDDVICRVKINQIKDSAARKVNFAGLRRKCATHIDSDKFYHILKSKGFQYGRSLMIIGESWKSRYEFIAEINFKDDRHGNLDTVVLHPAILDGALQTVALIPSTEELETSSVQDDSRWIPVKLKSLRVHTKPQKELLVLGKIVKYNKALLIMNLLIVDQNGFVVVEIEGYELQNIGSSVQIQPLKDKLYKLDWKRVAFESELSVENHRSQVITFTSEGSQLFQKYFPITEAKIAYVPFQSKMKSEDFWKKVLDTMRSQCGPLSTISEVLYYPGLHLESAGEDENDIFAMVKTSCLVLTYLIQHILEEGFDITVYVITKQCQLNLTTNEKDCKINVIGSELWGMGRCVLRERTFSKVRLIDFNDNSDMNLIKYIVFATGSEDWNTSPEYSLQNGCIFINQIVRFLSEKPLLRQDFYKFVDKVELRSKVQTRLETPFFVPFSDDFENVKNDCVEIKVTNSYFSDTWVSSFSCDLNEANPWSLFSKDGYQIFPTEIEGSTVSLETVQIKSPQCFSTSKVTPMQKSCELKEVITCFQVPCTNYVSVPEDCIIEKALIPWYKPCSLMEIIMGLELFGKCTSNLPIAIIYDENLHIDITVLKHLAKRLKKKLACVNDIGHLKNQIYNAKVQFVILSKDSSKVLDTLKRTNQEKITIVSFSSFITKSLERTIRRSYPRCILTLINSEEILSHEKLSISIKRIRNWLQSQMKSKQALGEFSSNSKHISGICFNVKNENNTSLLARDIPVTTIEERLFSPQAIYVVIGGLTGLGWVIVGNIAEKGGGVIAILCRRRPNEEQMHDISVSMKKHNCIIDSIQADISEKESIIKAFDYLKKRYPQHTIRGIFHGAAVVEDAIILKMTDEKFDKVLRPKVLGTWNLHLVSKNLNLDYFVLHSSMTSVFGNSGQTNYGAGNSFKDAIACYRRSIGMSAQSINWGALKLGILKTYEHIEKHLNSQGYLSLSESDIIDLFEYSLLSNDVQVICAMIDWKTVFRQSLDMPYLKTRMKPISEEYDLNDLIYSSNKEFKSLDFDELFKMTIEMQKLKLEEFVILIVADVCAVESSVLNRYTNLQVIGMDSMKGMAFINNVLDYVSCKISIISLLEETSTIETVANLIFDQLHAVGDKDSPRY